MIINTNINSLTGLDLLRRATLDIGVRTERLSSGVRINRAADDPSGLAISSGMKARIRGLGVALGNIQDGISMIRTMDGALGEVHDILLRMRDLTVGAANEATLTSSDRKKINSELAALKKEIDRAGASVTFNSKYVLSGGGSSPKQDRIILRTRQTGNFELISMNADGTEQVNLTNNPADDRSPQYSPDGSKITFTSDRETTGVFKIYVANADGSNPVKVSGNIAGICSSPQWSPDGNTILFYNNSSGPLNTDIYVVSADGISQPVNLTTENLRSDWEAKWSPDGSKILYMAGVLDPITGAEDTEIFTMNADGSGKTNISNDPDHDDRYAKWSPDGSKIAFRSNRSGNNELYTMNPDGTDVVNITNSPATSEDNYHWSPDGTRIAYSSPKDGDYEIYITNADGTNTVQITNNTITDDFLLNASCWMPDGRIGFHRGPAGNHAWVMNEDGSDARQVIPALITAGNQFVSFSPATQTNPRELQVGGENGASFRIPINFPVLTSGYLGLLGLYAGTAAGARIGITLLDGAIEKVSGIRADLGILDERLAKIADETNNEMINLSAANSTIADANILEEASALARSMIFRNTAISAISEAEVNSKNIMELLIEKAMG